MTDKPNTDLSNFEPEFESSLGDIRVQVALVGGGKVGPAHSGTWRYIVSEYGREVMRAEDLATNTPKTHREVAHMLISIRAQVRR